MALQTITPKPLYRDYEKSGVFNPKQLYYLELGLQEGLDTSLYANQNFNWKQMEQILFGLRASVDVSIYAKDFYSEYQMMQLRAALEHGLSRDKIDIIANPAFTEWQMCQIRVGFEVGINANEYADPSLSWQEMRKQYDRLCVEKHRLDSKINDAEEKKTKELETAFRMHAIVR